MTRNAIIVLADFSDATEPLLAFCADWCRQRSFDLLLFHHLSAKLPVIADESTRKELLRAKRDEAERRLHELAQTVGDLNPRFIVSEGEFCQSLNALAGEQPSRLIALGLKESGALKRLFIGSKATETIDCAIAPVIAVPQSLSRFNVETLYVSANRHYPVNLVSLNKLLAFHGESLKRLYFFSIVDAGEPTAPIDAYLSELSELYRERYLVGRFLLKSDNFLQDLNLLLYDKTRELLVLQRGSRLVSDKLFRSFFINDIAHSGAIPFAVLP